MVTMSQVVHYLCAVLLVGMVVRSASGGTVLSYNDESESGYYRHSRNGRSVIKIAENVLARMKEAFDNVMSGAREVESLSSSNYKIYVKNGGRKQAKKDFDKFQLTSIQHFTIRRDGTGSLGQIGDKIIVLENFDEVGRAQLIIKPRYGLEAGEYSHRILYRDSVHKPKGKLDADE